MPLACGAIAGGFAMHESPAPPATLYEGACQEALSNNACPLDQIRPECALTAIAERMPVFDEGFDVQDYEELRCISTTHFGKVLLWQHKANPSMCVVVKRVDRKACGVSVKQYHSLFGSAEDPFVEFGASLHVSGLSPTKSVYPRLCSFLPRTLGCWKDDTYAYLATEYCPGGELFEQVSDRGALPEEEVKKHIRGVLTALEHLHSYGIAHRDVSLENILLGDDGSVRLIDLGEAHELYDPRSGENVPARGMVGKDFYRAPEMYHMGKHGRASYAADKADMWQVAQCAVILLCGKPLWSHANEVYDPNGSFSFAVKHGLSELFKQWSLPFSKDASDFIQSMAHLDPMMRPSARQALEHPWLSTASRPAGDFP